MLEPLHSHALDVHTHVNSIRIGRQHVGMLDAWVSALLAAIPDVQHLVLVHVSELIVPLAVPVVAHIVQ